MFCQHLSSTSSAKVRPLLVACHDNTHAAMATQSTEETTSSWLVKIQDIPLALQVDKGVTRIEAELAVRFQTWLNVLLAEA